MRDANYEINEAGIAIVSIDMAGKLNIMNDAYVAMLDEALTRLEAERENFVGVIVTSAKDGFVAGGDVNKILALRDTGGNAAQAFIGHLKAQLRRLETLGRPVAAALNGTALGGGLELALACHYRVAIDGPKARFGFPEVGLGILPASGGVVRAVRQLGLLKALPLLTQGKQIAAREALALGLIDAVAADRAEMMANAQAWLLANPKAAQPWDRKGFAIPGGDMFNLANASALSVMPAMIFKQTRGLLPAAERILATAAESTLVGFEAALAIEGENFCELLASPAAESLMRTMFLQMNEISAGASRPAGAEKKRFRKVGVLGAGMMGRGIAHACASAGIEVVLKDVSLEAAEGAKALAAKIFDARVQRGGLTAAARDEALALIRPAARLAELAGCDLVIEAVFEDVALKQRMFAELAAVLPADAILATNTSTLPISLLAKGASTPKNFIGLHFFSPVEKMHVVEIICGAETGQTCLAQAYDFVQQIKKTPIVVNDHRGFFTSRVFSMYPDEGDRLLREGVDPAVIENLGRQTGMPVGPLAVQDEVMMDMMLRAYQANQKLDAELGGDYAATFQVCGETQAMMCGLDRPGRAAGRGFYDYKADGEKTLWPGLAGLFGGKTGMPARDIKDRLMFRMVVEALRCLDEGVVETLRDGNVGSILAFGFPVHTGGVFRFVQSYGAAAFMTRAGELARTYGARFEPPAGPIRRLGAGH
jgi:3-hydroxyacyl-CoA dehydrogenase/enoyl-CoA hydratase/3-hydroxybutyryl-CoA epimerase